MGKNRSIKFFSTLGVIIILLVLWFIRYLQLNKDVADKVMVDPIELPFSINTGLVNYEVSDYKIEEDTEFNGGQGAYIVTLSMTITSNAEEAVSIIKLANAFQLINQGRGYGTIQDIEAYSSEGEFLNPGESRQLDVPYKVWKEKDLDQKLQIVIQPSVYPEEYRDYQNQKISYYKALDIEVNQ